MTIDGNFPGEQASGGSRLYAVKLHATNEQGGSSGLQENPRHSSRRAV